MNFSNSLALYIVIAVGFSIFYGLKACEIFLDNTQLKNSCSWKFHQFWLNFTGAMVGWICLWFIGNKVLLLPNCVGFVDGWDIAIAFFAFVGITGYMPLTVVSLVNSIGAIVGKISGIKN